MSDPRTVKIIYNYDDDTRIVQTKQFRALPKIHQLDALQDGIELLKSLYNKKLDELHNGQIEGELE